MWERALRRSRLPVAYSQGFVPHPLVSFGLALPTGCESLGEYLDVRLGPAEAGEIPVAGLPAALSILLPEGIDVTAAALVEEAEGSLQQEVASCDWELEVLGVPGEELQEQVEKLLAAPILTVRRERKGRQAEDDIRPAILALSVTSPNGHLEAELATHPRGVRPGDLVAALGTDVVLGRACRTHQWIERDGARFEPLPLGGPGTGVGATRAREEGFPSCPRRKSARPRRVPPRRQRAALVPRTRRARPRAPSRRSVTPGPAPAAPPPPKQSAPGRAAGPAARPLRPRRPRRVRPGRPPTTRTTRGQAGPEPAPVRPGPALQAGGPLPGLRARAARHDPDRHARGPVPGRALRVPGGRRHEPDRRQRLPGTGPERAAGHGGGLRRHRHPEERRAVPGRRALRPRRHRGRDVVAATPDRRRAQGGADDPVPGDQEPDRGQGRPPDPGGLAARPLRRAGAQLERVRHLQAPRGHRATAAAAHHRRGEAGGPRHDRAHRRRGRLGRRAPAGRDHAARAVEHH